MFEVYYADYEGRNAEPEMIFSSYDDALNYVLVEQDKYSDDGYFEIYDKNLNRWY